MKKLIWKIFITTWAQQLQYPVCYQRSTEQLLKLHDMRRGKTNKERPKRKLKYQRHGLLRDDGVIENHEQEIMETKKSADGCSNQTKWTGEELNSSTGKVILTVQQLLSCVHLTVLVTDTTIKKFISAGGLHEWRRPLLSFPPPLHSLSLLS